MDTGEEIFQANRVACSRIGRLEQQGMPREIERVPP